MTLLVTRRDDASGIDTIDAGAAEDGPSLDLVRDLILSVGEDPQREGLLDTPRRVSRALATLTGGYRQSLDDIVGNAVFAEEYNEMVLVKDIEFYSLCEHHMLPFFGRAHVAYLPDGHVIGLSKIPRIVDMFARRLQVQERLTTQVAAALQDVLKPRGVGVVIEASHLCMMMRGVQKQNSATVTSCMLGAFQQPATRAEFLSLAMPIRRHD